MSFAHCSASGVKYKARSLLCRLERPLTARIAHRMSDQDAKGRQAIGALPLSGSAVSPLKRTQMHYRGSLTSGAQFDASYDRNTPFEFTLGAGQVIKGASLTVLHCRR